ncbi:hypothetical protein HYU14_04115 [Candidatus Woesearchaeota archaeon]|nr:hypothetical protein [Candidatus Woesearchaeota archaeon]
MYQSYFSKKASEAERNDKNGGGRSGGGRGCHCGPYGGLRETSENNPDKKADEIVKKWREEYA